MATEIKEKRKEHAYEATTPLYVMHISAKALSALG
jgi:hypothetical protein